MSENLEKRRSRVTTVQRILVGALALIFVIVLLVQFGSTGGSSRPADSLAQSADMSQDSADARRADARPEKTGAPMQPAPDRPWPVFSPASVKEFDPFAAPPILAAARGAFQPGNDVKNETSQASKDAEAKRKERLQKLEEVRKEEVQAILGTNRGFVAVVGAKIIHVGDQLHGFRVKEIKADGVILEDGNY
jgi:hypothetical protein